MKHLISFTFPLHTCSSRVVYKMTHKLHPQKFTLNTDNVPKKVLSLNYTIIFIWRHSDSRKSVHKDVLNHKICYRFRILANTYYYSGPNRTSSSHELSGSPVSATIELPPMSRFGVRDPKMQPQSTMVVACPHPRSSHEDKREAQGTLRCVKMLWVLAVTAADGKMDGEYETQVERFR